MTDTTYLDTSEKVDILLKRAFGFPSTSEKKPWYEETAVSYNNYLTGEDLFIDNISFTPDFDNSGIVRSANEIGLQTSNFVSYSDNSNNKLLCSIVDDSTGTIRRYKNIILEEAPELGSDSGSSWFRKNNSNNNILSDAFQFNYKQYILNDNIYQPYLYTLYTENSISTSEPDLPFGQKGGNWFFDTKSGLIFFSDFINFSNGVQTESRYQISNLNKPVLTFYKYIGRKGISYVNEAINNIQQQINNLDLSSLNIDLSYLNIDISLDIINDVKNDLSNLFLNFNDLSINFNNKINVIENSFNFVENKLINIDTSLIEVTQLIQDIRDICGSYFLEKIRNISGDVVNLESFVTNISGQLYNLVDVVNNLDISYLTDLSFIELVATINNLDISYVSDLCFNEYVLLQNNLINNIQNTLQTNDVRISDIVFHFNELSNNIFNVLNDISNRDISFNTNLDPYFNNQIQLLTSENVLLKTDINYNRSLIQSNSIDFDILKSRIEVIDENIRYFTDSLEDICGSNINDNLLNVISDISNSLNELNENFTSQIILHKSDTLIANSNINYNIKKIYLIEDDINKLNNKFSNLLTKFYNLDLSNILNIDSDVLLNLYDENKFLKADILIANSNNNYCQEKIYILDNLIENINSSISKLSIKTNNYNINNLYLFFNNVSFNLDNIYRLNIDHITTYKNGFYNNLLFKYNFLFFENLENLLLNNNSVFIELYSTCFFENNSNNSNISLNMISNDENITCLSNIVIGNNITNSLQNNNYLTFGPTIYKLTNNINDNKCIYYKNKFEFYLSSYMSNIFIHDIKIIIKILNYNL